MTNEQCRHLKIERYPPDTDNYQCERCLETFVVRLAAEPEAPLKMRTMRQYRLDAPYLSEAAHEAITRALAEAGIKQEVLVGMCIEVGLEAFRDALNRSENPK